ncbi:hypothetical protein FRX31_016077, partial [Thalictrum thalictroides]
MKDSNESTALYVPSITTNNVSFSRGGGGGRRGGGRNGPNRGRNNNNNNSGGNRYAKPCDVCGLHNHTTSRCWDVIGKPSSQHRANTSVVVSEGSSSASESDSMSKVQEDLAKLMKRVQSLNPSTSSTATLANSEGSATPNVLEDNYLSTSLDSETTVPPTVPRNIPILQVYQRRLKSPAVATEEVHVTCDSTPLADIEHVVSQCEEGPVIAPSSHNVPISPTPAPESTDPSPTIPSDDLPIALRK